MRYACALLATGVLTGCGLNMGMSADYDLGLARVDQPSELGDRYGEVERQVVGDSVKYVYSDSLIQVTWAPTPRSVGFILENRTAHSIKIVWDEAVFVDPQGITSRVMHEGVRYVNRNESQPPSIVAPDSRLIDLVAPTNYVVETAAGVGPEHRPFIEPHRIGRMEALNEETVARFQRGVRENQGKEFKVLLPLEIQGDINEYTFTFQVRGASVQEEG